MLVLALVASLAVAACGGGGGGNSKDATSLLDAAFKHPLKNFDVSVDADLQVNGVSSLKQPISLRVSGPIEQGAPHQLPKFDLSASIIGGGQSVPIGLRSIGDDIFLQLQGTWYELGKSAVSQIDQQNGKSQSLSSLGVHPLNWLSGAQNAGDATVTGGVKATHISADLDVGRLLDDLNQIVRKAQVGGTTRPAQLSASQKAEIQQIIKNPHLDVYVAKSDKTVRRIAGTLDFSVPKDKRSQLNGLSGGTLQISIDISNIGESRPISAPSGAEPLAGLISRLGGVLGSSSAGGTSSGGGTSGSSSPSAKQFQDYAKCVQKAGGSNSSALQKCASILSK